MADTSTVMEFDVQMSCGSCEKDIRVALQAVEGIHIQKLSHEEDKLVVRTTLPSFRVQSLVEDTGRKAVLKGMGGTVGPGGDAQTATSRASSLLSAVVMMYPSMYRGPYDQQVQGVTRLVQLDENRCKIEGTIDGLTPGEHGLHVHESGDLSQGCDSTGNHYNPTGNPHGGPDDAVRHAGDLGNVVADETGRATFQIFDEILKVGDIIGRSLVIKESADDLGRGDAPESKVDGGAGKGLACGIIARSAGLFANPKKICACDGKTLWDERQSALKATPMTQSR